MANNDLLLEFNTSDIIRFKKDFIQMMKVGIEIDRYYGEVKQDLDILIPKFEKLVEQFNKKYKGIKIKTRKMIDQFKVRVVLKVGNVKDFLAESASKISGLKSVGRTNSNQIDIGDADKFAKFLDSPLDKIHVSYVDYDHGTSSVIAVIDRNEKMVELIYNPVEIINENSAGFKICAFYALRSGWNKKIDIYGDALTFGFANLLDEIEKREWFDKFNPRYLE